MEALAKTVGLLWEKTLSSAAEGGMAVDLCAGMCQIDTKKKLIQKMF